MSTKTIAVDSRVYVRLAATKRESESFSKAIARLLDEAAGAHTGADILAGVQALPPLGDRDAETMMGVVRENRRESWPSHDLS